MPIIWPNGYKARRWSKIQLERRWTSVNFAANCARQNCSPSVPTPSVPLLPICANHDSERRVRSYNKQCRLKVILLRTPPSPPHPTPPQTSFSPSPSPRRAYFACWCGERTGNKATFTAVFTHIGTLTPAQHMIDRLQCHCAGRWRSGIYGPLCLSSTCN